MLASLSNEQDSIYAGLPVVYIFVPCIGISFVLLAWDSIKARKIIKSRNISFTYTSTIATRYYTMQSYAHHCFFQQVIKARKLKDQLIFFVFFQLKGKLMTVFVLRRRFQYITCTI